MSEFRIEKDSMGDVKVPAKAYLLEGPNALGPNHPKVRCFAAVYTLAPELEIATAYNGPPEANWRSADSRELIPTIVT